MSRRSSLSSSQAAKVHDRMFEQLTRDFATWDFTNGAELPRDLDTLRRQMPGLADLVGRGTEHEIALFFQALGEAEARLLYHHWDVKLAGRALLVEVQRNLFLHYFQQYFMRAYKSRMSI